MSFLNLPIPPESIAHTPAEPRDASRLLVWPPSGKAEDAQETPFSQLATHLKAGDLLVLNESHVIPARLFATRPARQGRGASGQPIKVELLLHRALNASLTHWHVYARPLKRLKDGDTLELPEGLHATISLPPASSPPPSGAPLATLCLPANLPSATLFSYLSKHGHTPLPPYISNNQDADKVRKSYQTTYADPAQPGSVAAPTAGLHFTPQVFEELKKKGINIARVTLHVGAGTFQNPTPEQILSQKLHSEYAHLSPETAKLIKQTKALGGSIVAVGTTSLRTLETWGQKGEPDQGFSGDTDIFIQPGYTFQVVDKLITNFHLAGSSLRMLVAAFITEESATCLYHHAIKQNFRFYSFGDTSLLTKAK